MTQLVHQLWDLIKQFPDYWPAAVAAAATLVIAVPMYLALWYFIHRRKLEFPLPLMVTFLGVFVLFSGLAFIFASPLADKATPLLSAYLFLTCVVAAYCVVELIDIFILQYYMVTVRKVYVSPPLRK